MRALHLFQTKQNNSLGAILLFCIPLFFILLADSVMSYIFPILVQNSTGSNLFLGLIMSLSSMLGIICDFTFPQIIRNRSWKFQLIAGIVLALLFPFFANLGAVFSIVYFFVIATLIWGVYFEFLQFCQQSFIVGEDKNKEYSKDWGILYFVYEITINLGPIIGSLLMSSMFITEHLTISTVQLFSLLCALIIIFKLPNHTTQLVSHHRQTINLFKELRYWEALGERIWPVIINGVMISCISASYWTIGGLLGLEIARGNGYDWLVMVLFGVPLIFGSLTLTKIKVRQHKKFYSQLSVLSGGILLSFLYFMRDTPLAIYILIAASSFAFSFAGPLNEAVYSDLLERSKKNRIHLLGIAKSNTSLAYIIAPLLVGFLADRTDYYVALSVVGGIAAVIATFLIFITPQKLKLPQTDLKHIS